MLHLLPHAIGVKCRKKSTTHLLLFNNKVFITPRETFGAINCLKYEVARMLFINNRIAIYRQKKFISYDDICDPDIIAKPIHGVLFLSTTRIPIVEYHGL